MTKEELREDPVLEQIQEILAFIERNSKWILIGIAVVAVLIVAGSSVRRARIRANAEASELLGKAQIVYVQGNLTAAETQLRELLRVYPSTRAAGTAWLYLGNVLLAQGRSEEAFEAYQKALERVGKDPVKVAGAHRGMGKALASLGRYADAALQFEQAAALATPLQVEDLIDAGRCSLEAGDKEKAQQLLKKASDLKGSEAYPELDLYLAAAEVT